MCLIAKVFSFIFLMSAAHVFGESTQNSTSCIETLKTLKCEGAPSSIQCQYMISPNGNHAAAVMGMDSVLVDLASCKATNILNQQNIAFAKGSKFNRDDPPYVLGWSKDSSIVVFVPFDVGNTDDFNIYDTKEKKCFGYCSNSSSGVGKQTLNMKSHAAEIVQIKSQKK